MAGKGSICAIYGCTNYKIQKNNRKSFFRFPKNQNLCAQWVVKSRSADLDAIFKAKGSEYMYKNCVVCSDHFENHAFRNKNLLSQGIWPGAVPQLLLCEETTSKLIRSNKRKRENSHSEEIDVKPALTNSMFIKNEIMDETECIIKENSGFYFSREPNERIITIQQYGKQDNSDEVTTTIKNEFIDMTTKPDQLKMEEIDIKDEIISTSATSSLSEDPLRLQACNSVSDQVFNRCSMRSPQQICICEKRFACSLCEYKSLQKSKVKRHMNIHTGRKMQFTHKKCYLATCTVVDPSRSFHEFPSKKFLREKWLEVLQLDPDKEIPGTATICSLHFEKSCYKDTSSGRRMLKRDAIPTQSFN